MRGLNILIIVATFLSFAAAADDAPATAAEGQAIWDEKKRAKCVTCHGPDGKGDTKMGRSKKVADMTTEEWQKRFTDQQIIDSILTGVEREGAGRKVKMEPLKEGTQREAEALLAFIRTLGPKK
jgi:mono/diheme cytochrome c family protein